MILIFTILDFIKTPINNYNNKETTCNGKYGLYNIIYSMNVYIVDIL